MILGLDVGRKVSVVEYLRKDRLVASLFCMLIMYLIGIAVAVVHSISIESEKEQLKEHLRNARLSIFKLDQLKERTEQLYKSNKESLLELDRLKIDVRRFAGDEWLSEPPSVPGYYKVIPQSWLIEVFISSIDGELWFEEPCGNGPDGLCLKRVEEAHDELRWGSRGTSWDEYL